MITRVVLVGACGRMGQTVQALVAESHGITIAQRIDPALGTSFADQPAVADVVIDFSTPAALTDELEFCVDNGLSLVLATTGHTDEAQARIEAAAQSIAILQSANLSFGAYVLTQLALQAKALLGNSYDISIVEAHHKMKKDAPSGTAKQIAAELGAPGLQMLSVRGGMVIGEHECRFLGERDMITLRHEAHDRRLFAQGALDAAKWIAGCAPGLYRMADFVEAQGKA